MPTPVVQIWSATGTGSIVSIGVAVSGVTAGNALQAVCSSIPISTGSSSTVTASGSVNGSMTGGIIATGPDSAGSWESISVFHRNACSAGGQTVTVSSTGNQIDHATLLVMELPPSTFGGVANAGGASQQGVTSLASASYTPSTGGTITAFTAALRASNAANVGLSDPPTGWSSVYAQQNGTLAPFATMEVALKHNVSGMQSSTYTWSVSGTGDVAIWDIFQAASAILMGQASL